MTYSGRLNVLSTRGPFIYNIVKLVVLMEFENCSDRDISARDGPLLVDDEVPE